MFTGIIETLATLEKTENEEKNIHLTFSSSISNELKIDQSVAHNGVCLTVVKTEGNTYQVTAIEETLKRSNLGEMKVGDQVNIERCMPANGRFDGHIVQGHVDTTAKCTRVRGQAGSWEFEFEHEAKPTNITVEKGSITINGVSLTVVISTPTTFSVHVIPYTFENTCFKTMRAGSKVNIEFDVIGKYVAKIMSQRK